MGSIPVLESKRVDIFGNELKFGLPSKLPDDLLGRRTPHHHFSPHVYKYAIQLEDLKPLIGEPTLGKFFGIVVGQYYARRTLNGGARIRRRNDRLAGPPDDGFDSSVRLNPSDWRAVEYYVNQQD